MQALILAAGMGNRLGKYTKDNTKCMLEINNKTLIEQAIRIIKAVGINKLILVVGYKRENLIDYLENNQFGVEIEYVVNEDYDTTNNIYSLFLAKEKLLSDDTLLIESDLIFEESVLSGLVKDDRPNLAVVDKFQSWMDGTVVSLDESDNITDFIPKASFDFEHIDHYFKTVNIYKFSKEFSKNVYLPFLEAYSSALGKNEYYEQVLRVIGLLEDKGVQAYRLNGEKWYEIDDLQDKDNAEVVFAPTVNAKLELLQKRFGGYWRYHDLIDFCYLVNPYFPSKQMESEMKAYFHTLLREYPSGLAVQNLLASKMFGINDEYVVVGNGASELINVLPDSLTGTVGITFPSFNEYAEAFGESRVVSFIPDNDSFNYSIADLERLSDECDNVLLINPDNPSGHFITKNDVLILLKKLKLKNKILILDESFVDFAENGEEETLISDDILEEFNNLIVIKSISKSYGVPGARLGVIVTSNLDVLNTVREKISIWNINSFGEHFLQIIGKYKKDYIHACMEIRDERKRFFNEISKIDYLTVYRSEANYFLCKVLQNKTAKELTEKLIEMNIFIKDFLMLLR